ncbi:MAG: ABC transporter substrate-binding protein [Candidatus Rokubacteria bacterium]|nr:ABC transporter substrate-binding protein [Candidatus Rokubacteria bacterium]
MTRHRRPLAMAAVLGAILVAGTAFAGPPTEQLKSEIDRVVKTLDDPNLKGDAKTVERRSRVRFIANDIFDWAETAKRSLARHWQPLSDGQREEFVKLFGDLLERSYISKIELYGGERILYVGESIDGNQAAVRTKITTKQGTDVPIEYRMIRRGDRWMVYDVVIESVSLVSNYRTQFNKIIQTSSYQELVKKMKTKQEEFQYEESTRQKRTSQR